MAVTAQVLASEPPGRNFLSWIFGKIILTPTTKEPKICHALASTSVFNLKLCL